MQIPQRHQPRLIGLALGVLLALLIWPATRWLVWSQAALSLPTPASIAPWSGEITNTPQASRTAQQRYHETALRHPDDYLLQFADAVVVAPPGGNMTPDLRVERMGDLTRRFPDRPALYAAALRFATQEQVRIEREEEKWLTGEKPGARSASLPPPNTPEHLASYDRNAVTGERLDPLNAYFPLMRAVGLFAAHRDSEALAALQRAAQKPVWNDYCTAELDAEWRLHRETFGSISALPRMMFAFAILLPHLNQMRPLCRVAIAKAAQSEQAGHIEEGLRIRTEVRKCGRLLRIQSTNALGSLIGIMLNRVSMSRPCGAPSVTDRSWEQRAKAFDSYLKRTGHEARIAEWHAETEQGERARAIARSASRNFFDVVPVALSRYWIAALVLLTNALWMLGLASAASLLARCRLIRTGQGLPPGARIGPALGIAAGVLIGMRLAVMGLLGMEDPASYTVLAGALFAGVVALALPTAKAPVWVRRTGAFCLGLAGTALLCSAFALHIGASIHPIVQTMWGMASENAIPAAPIIQICCVGLAAVIPLLSLLAFSLLSRMWHVPLSVGVVRGLRGCGVQIACILLLAYGVLVPFTLHQERALEYGLKRTAQHEGRFLAEMAGKSWPGE